jgi:hypothetical protein
MAANRRKSVRQSVSRTALIGVDDGSQRLQSCRLVDVSDSGGQLLLATAAPLPAEFTLVLSHGARVKRRCQVAWQEGRKAGVRFVVVNAQSPFLSPVLRRSSWRCMSAS